MRVLVVLILATSALAKPKVLFLTHSAGYRHQVVTRPGPGELSLAEKQLVASPAFLVTATQDCSVITPASLAQYDAVVFYTTGNLPLGKENRHALIAWVRGGGAFVGIHPATDTMYEFADYGRMIGGVFNGHPWHQSVRVRVEREHHPATAHLGGLFTITDEIYEFRGWARRNVTVLLSLDTTSVDTKKKGVQRTDHDFALAWCKRFGRGRVFYTALGHRADVWQDERFLAHVRGGIEWVIRGEGDGFQRIQNRPGWRQAGPGGFRLQNGIATPHGGMGLWYYPRVYRNFILRLSFRQEDQAHNSGVFIRFPDPGDDPWVAVKQGHEVQIAGTTPSKHATGAIYGFQPATDIPLKPAGEWNDYEIACIGRTYYVRLNDRLINVFRGARQLEGMIGVQNHDPQSVVEYRDIRVRELPDKAIGELTKEGVSNHLLLAEWRGDAILNAGGIEGRIEGSQLMYGEETMTIPVREGWNHCEILVLGNDRRVWINGKLVIDGKAADGGIPAAFAGSDVRHMRVIELK